MPQNLDETLDMEDCRHLIFIYDRLMTSDNIIEYAAKRGKPIGEIYVEAKEMIELLRKRIEYLQRQKK